MKFSATLDETGVEVHSVLCEAKSSESSNKMVTYKQHKYFKNERTSADDDGDHESSVSCSRNKSLII